jgi:hypothetical protein
MRHIQLYEEFDQTPDSPQEGSNKLPAVTVYNEYEDWVEFMRCAYGVQNWWMWRDRTTYQSPSYAVNNEWVFWLDSPEYGMENSRGIVVLQLNKQSMIIAKSDQSKMEAALGCSYKDLIPLAKTPEESMKDEIVANLDLINEYSESRPRVFKKFKVLPNLSAQVKAALRWKEMKDYI